MKLKVLVSVLFLAGILASLALGAPSATRDVGTTTSTSTDPKPPKCPNFDLRGDATAGSITLTVNKANKGGQGLVGQTITVTIPAGAHVHVHACSTDGGTTLTLKKLDVKVPKPPHTPPPGGPKPNHPAHTTTNTTPKGPKH